MERAPRLQCHLCNEWSRELVAVATEFGKSSFAPFYYVHEYEVSQMKNLVKAAKLQAKADKAEALRTYGQRYHH